jgi:hypothetical protein
MKHLLFFSILLLLENACQNPPTPERQKAKEDTAGEAVMVATDSPKKDTVLFVGVSAQWDNGGESFQGNYDSATGIFMMCGKTTPYKATPDQIVYLANGTCDTALGARVHLMEFDKKDTSLSKTIGQLVLVEPARNTDSPVQFMSAGRVVNLRKAEATRVQKAVAHQEMLRAYRVRPNQ